jgi:hypothetical protein
MEEPKAADVFSSDEIKLLIQTVETSTYAGKLSDLVSSIRAKLDGRKITEAPTLKEVP